MLLWLAGPAAAGEGAAVFERHCASCHSTERGAPPGAGPNLAGLAGRVVGGDPVFGHSPALAAAHAAGDTWDAARLERFLDDPQAMYAGSWMGADGLRRPQERRAVVDHLLR